MALGKLVVGAVKGSVSEIRLRAVGAAGAAPLQSDIWTADVPHTAGIDELFRAWWIATLGRTGCSMMRSVSSTGG